MNRKVNINRNTKETKIAVELNLDGNGVCQGSTGIGFFDHMLDLFIKHSNMSLKLDVVGDLQVDAHHTVEDLGIVLGEALKGALGDKKGIERYGSIILPMDEVLIMLALDLGGRPFFVFDVELPYETIGNFETELVEEFLRAFIMSAGMNLHVRQLSGKNTHHIIEGVFKALARAVKMAVRVDERNGIPSTKGSI
ncbi:MAG: imidazoleglycerol-phosphate dehydratase [Fusobacteria bacterium]|nr:MAG: imidazoleglycerol-phosphate dehydratase [Fusobacteriota bacterium]KAF0229718.1 MAG: imidazoleglycerol-phosphate [Fusobacteriota bacterium]